MSDDTYATSGGTSQDASGDSHKVEAVKHEAAELKDTATGAAADVAGTAKEEAVSVAQETKAQAIDLFHQGREELADQASKQQQRIASGLDSLGSELSTMASSSQGSGIASDLVQKAADRVSGAASWLSSREPSGVLQDVKSFARRRPGAFIGGALLAGIAAGRLTRALATNAKESSRNGAGGISGSGSTVTPPATPPAPAAPVAPVAPPVAPASHETPVYAESAARLGGPTGGQGVADERPDTL